MSKKLHVILIGDFNTRTNNQCDYEILDEHILVIEESDLDIDEMRSKLNPEPVLNELGLPHVRAIRDK